MDTWCLQFSCIVILCVLANWLDMRAVRAVDVQIEAGKRFKELTDVLKGRF